jgi:hypothetical protein
MGTSPNVLRTMSFFVGRSVFHQNGDYTHRIKDMFVLLNVEFLEHSNSLLQWYLST